MQYPTPLSRQKFGGRRGDPWALGPLTPDLLLYGPLGRSSEAAPWEGIRPQTFCYMGPLGDQVKRPENRNFLVQSEVNNTYVLVQSE